MFLSVVTVCSMFWIVVRMKRDLSEEGEKDRHCGVAWVGAGEGRWVLLCWGCVGVFVVLAPVLVLGIKARLRRGAWC